VNNGTISSMTHEPQPIGSPSTIGSAGFMMLVTAAKSATIAVTTALTPLTLALRRQPDPREVHLTPDRVRDSCGRLHSTPGVS